MSKEKRIPNGVSGLETLLRVLDGLRIQLEGKDPVAVSETVGKWGLLVPNYVLLIPEGTPENVADQMYRVERIKATRHQQKRLLVVGSMMKLVRELVKEWQQIAEIPNDEVE